MSCARSWPRAVSGRTPIFFPRHAIRVVPPEQLLSNPLEVNVNSTRFSPIKPLAVSLALALGILVADLTGRPLVPAAEAQDSSDCTGQFAVKGVPVGTAVPISEGTLKGGPIALRGVIVSGDEVDAIVDGDLLIADGVLFGDDTVRADGLVVDGGATPCTNSVIVSGEVVSAFGVIVSGDDEGSNDGPGAPAEFEVFGGTIEGDNLRVEGGVLRGDNLRLVGGHVKGSSLRVVGASISVTIAPVE